MPTTAAKTAKPKATATKATKAAPKKAAKSTKAAKAKKAAPVAPGAAAVDAFTDAYRAWYSTRTEAGAPHVNPETWRDARVKLCTLAGCEEPGTGHRLAQCHIKTEVTDLMAAVQRACMPAHGFADRTSAAAAVLTHRLTEITA